MAKWIAKANDDVLSHCRCEAPLAGTPGQLDCPWCGCGWLISCAVCRRAFAYGRVVEIEQTTQQFIADDYARRGFKSVTADEIKQDAAFTEDMLAPFGVGEIVVYLDGLFVALHERDVSFTGIFAKHRLDTLPHAAALQTPATLRETLGDKRYWLDRERPDRD
jgi:hypothetical protein